MYATKKQSPYTHIYEVGEIEGPPYHLPTFLLKGNLKKEEKGKNP